MTNATLITPRARLLALQKLLKEKRIDAWIVPSADPHQSEYVADCWQARAWLSGFHGSAGTLVIMPEQAALWTDPRYHIRAEQELAGSGIDLFRLGLPGVPSHTEWLAADLKVGATVGFDASLLSIADVDELSRALSACLGDEFAFFTAQNLVDEIWQDRPGLPKEPIFLHEERYAGESRGAKLARIRRELQVQGTQAHLLTALDDIAWTFNIRGDDVAYNPVAVAYGLILIETAYLLIDPDKVSPAVATTLEADGVQLKPYEAIESFGQLLPSATTVLIDPDKSSYRFTSALTPRNQLKMGSSIPHRLKAIKNDVEVAGMRCAHLRDGVAMVRWLIWLEGEIGRVTHTEITVAEKLAEFRSQGDAYQGLSFGTISGYKANSAVGHYSPQPETTPFLYPEGVLLIDSGAQYLDGTTDITRTITLGAPTAEEKQVFTRVLQCQIKLATALFPQGTRGDQLDALAREPLWRQGWNCRHGIGHGIGHFLNVHEGPQRFSPQNRVELLPGMVTSNEPGVYFEGAFGVRIENLLLTIPHSQTAFGHFNAFETLTLCPIDLELVDETMLSLAEQAWLNAYHQRVYQSLAPFLAEEEKGWLAQETRAVGSRVNLSVGQSQI